MTVGSRNGPRQRSPGISRGVHGQTPGLAAARDIFDMDLMTDDERRGPDRRSKDETQRPGDVA